MRYMVIVKSTPETEHAKLPDDVMTEMFATMGKYNEELAQAGHMLAGEGLMPSSSAAFSRLLSRSSLRAAAFLHWK